MLLAADQTSLAKRDLLSASYISCSLLLPVWLSGNTLVSINVVTLRWARLVPGWVIIVGRVNHLGSEPGTQA